MKFAPFLLAAIAVSGCGGGTTTSLPLDGTLAPGYYAVTSRVLRRNAAARDYTGRVSVTSDGTIRFFGLDPSNSRITLTRVPEQLNTDGTNADAFLDGTPSTGELTAGVTNLLSFAGTAFSLTADGTTAPVPTLGSGNTLTAGTYRGELVRLGSGGAVVDWGTASATLTITTPTPGAPVNTLTVDLVSTAGTSGTVQSRLATDGTATSTTATAGAWRSDGNAFSLRLTGGDWGTGGLYLVLTRRTP